MEQILEAAGIAPASRIPQVVFQHDSCVQQGCQWLHYVCTDATLRELVANWHRLTPEVRELIMELAKGGGKTLALSAGFLARSPVNCLSDHAAKKRHLADADDF